MCLWFLSQLFIILIGFETKKLWQHLWWESNFIFHKLWKSDHSLRSESVHIPLWSCYKGGTAHSMLITQSVHGGCCSWIVDTGHLERKCSGPFEDNTPLTHVPLTIPVAGISKNHGDAHVASWPSNPMASPPGSNDSPSISPQHLLSSCHNLKQWFCWNHRALISFSTVCCLSPLSLLL